MLSFNLKNGQFTYELEEKISYANKGGIAEATTLICSEPIKSAVPDCLLLTQMLKRFQVEAMRAFFGDSIVKGNEKKAEGEEVIPFHKRPEVDEKQVVEEAKAIVEMLMTSTTPPIQFIQAGKKILTTRYTSKEGRNLCVVNDENLTRMTASMFDDMTYTDQMLLIAVYIVFFGLSLTGQRKIMSGTV